MRVAIVSCYDKINYGSMLQAYATQAYLDSAGVTNITLDRSGLANEIAVGRRRYYRQNLLNVSLYRAKAGFVFHRLRQRLSPAFAAKIDHRRTAFSEFSSKHFRLSPKASSFSALSEYCTQFDAVVLGSDQLWLPVNIAGDYFTLSFVPTSVKRIAYATSFGIAQLPETYKGRARNFLSKFDSISVREESGKRIIDGLLDRPVEVVVDPTMLLTPDQWQTVEADASVIPAEPYVLCYFLGKNVWNRQCAQKLAAERGCKIVALIHLDEYVAYDETYADFTPFDVGPGGFVKLVRNASYVCTDSFHGTVFSILFRRQFFCFRRHESVGSESTNSRLDTLLGRLGLVERIVERRECFDAEIDRTVDYGPVGENVSALRSQSEYFLKRALGLRAS
jgi:hypothetical protein